MFSPGPLLARRLPEGGEVFSASPTEALGYTLSRHVAGLTYLSPNHHPRQSALPDQGPHHHQENDHVLPAHHESGILQIQTCLILTALHVSTY